METEFKDGDDRRDVRDFSPENISMAKNGNGDMSIPTSAKLPLLYSYCIPQKSAAALAS
jgi:hypothetical protein